MESLLHWGIGLITAIQQVHGPILDSIFRAITLMGEEEVYLLLVSFIFWCMDFGLGVRLAVLFLLSGWLNINLKDLLQQPRPFDLDRSVMLASADGFGMPSGHAQSATVVWGSIALWRRKTWVWVVAIGLIILIGFSRVYLGVHFPTDVLAGWLIGAVLIGVFFVAEPAIQRRFMKLDLWLQLIMALAVPLVLFLIHPVRNTASAMGTLAGGGLGLILTYRYISFSVHALWWHLVVRFIIGIIVVFALYMGLGAVFPGDKSALSLAFRYLHFGLIGIWVSLGAPWLFQKLRLGGR